eukprot:GFYU01000484.1.p1 GENE.GFYU01000484.1~~GFYU01000484.1.p1  ORF type:complete len:350 (+),score=60.73 GFYU01000484.1:267-1316(+)
MNSRGPDSRIGYTPGAMTTTPQGQAYGPTPTGEYVMQMPVKHYTASSPQGLFRGRYRLNEDITAGTSIVYGIDKRARNAQNQKILIRIFDHEGNYQREVDLFKTLRSQYVANMVDHWHSVDPWGERFYIVVERGGTTLDELIGEGSLLNQETPKEIEARKDILMDLAQCWLFLNSHGCYLQLQTQSFMDYKKQWKLVDFDFVYKYSELTEQPNPLYCERPICHGILEGTHSIILPRPAYDFTNFATIILELFLFHPLFCDKNSDEIYQLAELDENQLSTFISYEDDAMDVVSMVRVILRGPESEYAGGWQEHLSRIGPLLQAWSAHAGYPKVPGSRIPRRTAGYLPSIV